MADNKEGKVMMKFTKRQIRGYREFLYILPFLILVLMFSYYPLYGWVYAFFDFRPPQPLSQSKFVALKWFKYMVENPTRLKKLLEVLRNTLWKWPCICSWLQG